MPIPGPSAAVDLAVDPVPTGSPFWLSVHGAWYPLEGVVPGVTIGSERARSSVTTEGGRRYEQRARLARRSWEVSLPYASANNLAVLRIAAESDEDVWLMSDAVAAGNMLGNRDCWGTGALVDCNGLLLPAFAAGDTVTGRVRDGVPTTVSAWLGATLATAVTVTYPGGSSSVGGASGARVTATFTPTADGVVTIEAGGAVSGLMLTEGDPLSVFVPGEAMPCKVVVDDPSDVLTMHHGGAWRHEYGVQLREVG